MHPFARGGRGIGYHDTMHLKIAHQLSLLLAAIVVLAVASVGGLTVWNLRNGFNDYLRLRDDEQLMRLVKLVERRATSGRGGSIRVLFRFFPFLNTIAGEGDLLVPEGGGQSGLELELGHEALRIGQ